MRVRVRVARLQYGVLRYAAMRVDAITIRFTPLLRRLSPSLSLFSVTIALFHCRRYATLRYVLYYAAATLSIDTPCFDAFFFFTYAAFDAEDMASNGHTGRINMNRSTRGNRQR